MTQLGCPFCCVYCGESTKGLLEGGKIIRKRSLKIANLMEKYHKKYGVVWGFNTRIDCLDKEILRKFKKAGCVYMFAGVESLVPEVLAGMNKIIPGLNKDYPPVCRTPEDYIKRTKNL